MHLLHPSFHERIENDTHHLYHAHADPGEKLMEQDHHFCPFCEFFTVNQFFLFLFKSSSDGDQQYNYLLSICRLPVLKTCAKHVDPRASPFLV